jgi:hypothetical protein
VESHKASKRVTYVDVSGMHSPADYGGLIFELKKMGIVDGRDYQTEGNGLGLFMQRASLDRCQGLLAQFGARPMEPRRGQ